MTRVSEVAKRYAASLYESVPADKADQTLQEMRVVAEALNAKPELKDFFFSPLTMGQDKTKAFAALGGKLSEPVIRLLDVMTAKGRLPFIEEVALGFEALIDEKHGVTRGTVRSAAVLDPEQRKSLEETVRKVTGKQVILKFEVDPSLIGGLVAQVGGWTFDDSLMTHLTSMKEGLSRPTIN